MPKIYLPSVKAYRDIDQIVAFGCSMTQGSELCDNLRYPAIPNVEEYKKSFKDIHDWYRSLGTELEPGFREEERKLAWPSQLAKLYSIPCYNYAEGGSGFEKQLTQFIKAVYDKKITDKTLVVWGLTTKERGIWIQPHQEITGYLLNGVMDPGELPSDAKNFWYMHVNSNMMLYWKYYNCLSIMFNWASEFCNDQFLFVQSVGQDLVDKNCFNEVELEYLSSNPVYLEIVRTFQDMLISKSKKYRIFNDERHFFHDWTGPNKLGGGHPTLSAHIKYAEMIKFELGKSID